MIATRMIIEFNHVGQIARRLHNRAAETVKTTALDIERDAREQAADNGSVDLGDLVAGIRAEAQGDLTWTVTAYAEHSIYVEEGTRPHMPPVEALRGWADRHGMDPWPLALHIREHGTPAQPFMAPAVERNRGPFMSAMRQIVGGEA